MIPDFPHTVGNETPHWGKSFPTPWGKFRMLKPELLK